MKSKIDLSDPQNKKWLSVLKERREISWKAAMKFNDAVRSIYFPLPGKQHPQQTGSCVLLNLNENYFVLSAAHVLEDCGKYQILIGCGDQLHPIDGERFSTVPGPSGSHSDDPIDVAVVHMKGDIPEDIRNSCVSISDLDFSALSEPRSFFITKGFRANQSRIKGDTAISALETYSSVEYSDNDYALMGINRDHQLAIAYEEQMLVDGKIKNTPIPKGMSGGAIIRIRGVPTNPNTAVWPAADPKITGVLIEYRPRHNNLKSRIIGARVQHHLYLISKHLPQVGKWIRTQISTTRTEEK